MDTLPARQKYAATGDSRLERLIHASPAIAFVREPAGAFTFVSDGVTRALGWAPEALVADPGFWAERIHPDDKARVMDQFAGIAGTGHCASQYRLRHADGDYRWMREEMRVAGGDDGHDTLIGHWIDITENRHAEEALRDNERRFKDFAESVSDWFWETDSRHRFTAFSGDSKRDVAWVTKASIGKTRFDNRLRDDRDDKKWDAHRADLGARRSFRNLVFPVAAEDGSTRHIRVGGRPLFSEAGDFRGYRGTATDVTAIVEAEQRAAAAHALLRDAIESIPDGLAVYDADDKLVLYNEAFRRGVLRGIGDTIEAGVTFEELLRLAVARGLTHIPDGDEEAYIQARLEHHRRGEGSLEVPLLNDRWMLSRERRMAGGGTIGTRTEITESKRIEAELTRHRDRLEELVEERTRELEKEIAERKQTETALRESEERFASIVANVPGTVYRRILTADGVLTYDFVSTSLQDIFGIDPEELVRDSSYLSTVVHPDDLDAYRTAVAESAEKLQTFDMAYRLIGVSGEIKWARSMATPRPLSNGDTVWDGVVIDITGQKKAEQALLLTQRSLDQAGDSVFWLDRDGRITYVNDTACQALGYSRRDMLTLTIHDIDISVTPDRFAQSWERLREQSSSTFESVHKRRDGASFPVEATTYLMVHDGTELMGSISRDITERKRAERELREKSALLEATFESISEGFALFDSDDCLVFCNDAYRRFSAPIADLVVPGVPYETLVRAIVAGGHAAHSGDTLEEKVRRRMARHRDPGGTLEVELGDSHWLLIAERRTDDGGTTLVQTDITDMKRAEAELRLTQTRLADAVESLPTGLTLYDSEDRLILFNSKTTDFFPDIADDLAPGARREDLLRHLAAAGRVAGVHGHEQAWVKERLAAVGDSGLSDVVTLSDGRTLQSIRRRTSEGGSVGVMVEITERMEIEKALIEAKEQADAANQAKSDFLSRMSHELRTPMNAILGFGQLLESDPRESLSDSQSSSVRHIIKAGDHLLELINDVLDLVRIEGGRIPLSIETVSPRDVIEPSLSLVRNHAAKRDIQLIDRSAARNLPDVTADFTRFKQALINLLSNAVKYNREGGAVFLDSEPAGDMVRLTVTDTGPGIPEHEHAHLFEPFTRVKDTSGEVEGTGIGLTITKQLVELMGGRIGFESAPGRGSSFWFELPLAHRAAEPAQRPEALAVDEIKDIGEEIVDAPTVLYVEDDAMNLRLMEQIIQRFTNIELVSAHTAEIALEIVRTQPPDVILMDINLPGMNGTEALRILRDDGATSSIPVIAVSANAMPGDIREGLKAGFDGYLTKPIRIAEVLNVIKQAIARPHPDV